MNALVTLSDGKAVTTSLAIAEGTENEHRAVLQLIRKHQARLSEFGRVAFQMRPFETAGGTQQREVANLNEPQATLLLTMMRNSPIVLAFKVRLVKAFYELAHRAAQPDPANLTRMDLIQIAMQAETERLALAQQVAELEPKAVALERFTATEGKHSARTTAKLLGLPEKTFIAWCIGHNWLYRDRSRRLCAIAARLAVGSMDTQPVQIYGTRGPRTVAQPLFTQKGLTQLATQLARDGLITNAA